MKSHVNIQGVEDIKTNILYIINISTYYVKSNMIILLCTKFDCYKN